MFIHEFLSVIFARKALVAWVVALCIFLALTQCSFTINLKRAAVVTKRHSNEGNIIISIVPQSPSPTFLLSMHPTPAPTGSPTQLRSTLTDNQTVKMLLHIPKTGGTSLQVNIHCQTTSCPLGQLHLFSQANMGKEYRAIMNFSLPFNKR